MFQFRRFPSYTYGFSIWYMSFTHMDCSIRISAGLCSLTAHRSFSQLTTSFIGSQCQGIRPALLLALPFVFSEFSWILCSFFTRLLNYYLKIVSFHLIVFPHTFLIQFSRCLFSIPFQEQMSENIFMFPHICFWIFFYGGHKWTRTTDLTLIRRAL